mgnify:CR=1 FL=1
MKNIISIILISTLGFSSLSYSSEGNVQSIIKSFKKSLLVDYKSEKDSIEEMVASIIKNKITFVEVENYVQVNSTLPEYLAFRKMMNLVVDDMAEMGNIESSVIANLMNEALRATETSGANFISCSTGKSIGIPAILSSAVLSVASVLLVNKSKGEVVKKYMSYRVNATEEYLNDIADLKFEKATYEADVVYYNDEISELNRRITSGLYTPTEVVEYKVLITEYEGSILDAQNLISEVNSEFSHFDSLFEQGNQDRIQDEKSDLADIDKKISKGKKLGIAAAISGSLGGVILSIGNMDCN